MTEQEIVEFAKQNDYCHGGLKRRHPEVAEWMEKHYKECGIVDDYGNLHYLVCEGFFNYSVYRLRHDYELPSLEDQAKASLKEGWTFVGRGLDKNIETKPCADIANHFHGLWHFGEYKGSNMEDSFYAVRNDAPDEIWQRFGIERNPHKPAEKKWWFRPSAGIVCGPQEKPWCDGWVEVTAEYADYLSNKPKGECELRLVKKGDKFKSLIYNEWGVAAYDFIGNSCKDRGYRWCKIKPQGRWVEYDVVLDGKSYHVPSVICSPFLSDCIDIKGFGGIRFLRHDGTLTEFFTDRLAHIEDGKPCDPVKVRFWESK